MIYDAPAYENGVHKDTLLMGAVLEDLRKHVKLHLKLCY